MAREDELKFAVHGLFTLPDLVDVAGDGDGGVAHVHRHPSLQLAATYHDTEDLRLAREGVTLRHRTGEGPPTWHLKLPVAGSGPSVREEIAVPGGPDELPEQLRELLGVWLRGAALRPVATLATEREVYLLCSGDGSELAELVDDTVSVLDGERVLARFREIEVERRAAVSAASADAALARVADRLVAAGAVGGQFVPKVVRALGPKAQLPGDLPQVQPVGPRDPAAAVVARSLRDGVGRLVAQDAGVRRGEDDAVHQMRVACRRMRSDLRTFAPLVQEEWASRLREELSWLADLLGGPRDLEVQRARVRRTAAADPLSPLPAPQLAALDSALVEREDAARAAALEGLRSPRYQALVADLVAAAREPRTTALAARPCAQALPPLVRTVWRDMARRAAKLEPAGPDEAWHKVRILAKRARYAAEAVAPALGKGPQRTAKAAASAQELLGEHQDAAVAAETLAELAGERPQDGELGLTVGRLVERERGAVRAARAGFPATWRKADRAKVTRWMSA